MILLEAVVRKCSSKWCFWKFCNIHRKTLVLETLFNKVEGLKASYTGLKDSYTGFFLWILWNFLEHFFFYRTPPVAAFLLSYCFSQHNLYSRPDNCPWGKLPSPPRQLPPGQLPLRNIASGFLLPDNYPKDNCPLTIYPWKLPPEENCLSDDCRLHNCPSDKWPRGKLPSRKIVPRINYTRDIFSQESEIAVL